jgi:hypothetical protein
VGVGSLLLACNSSSGGTTSPDGGHETDTGSTSKPDGTPTDGHASDAKPGSGSGSGSDGGSVADGSSDTPDSGGSGTGSGDSGSPKKDGGGGGSCAKVDGGGKAYTGVFLLSQVTYPTPASFGGLGDFRDRPDGGSPQCTGMTMGNCCYSTPPAATAMVSAGTVTVDDGTTTIATLMSPDYVASSSETATFTWAPGDTLKVSATGAAFDAFSVKVKAPALLVVTQPAFTGALAVPLNADYVVTWTPSAETCSQVEFGLSQGTGMPSISCVADDSDGKITVPKAFLAKLTATTGTAVIQRLETSEELVANAGAGVVAANVLTTTTTYSQ